MKVITELKGMVNPTAVYTEERGTVQSVHCEPQPGFFLRVQLGSAGVTVRRPSLPDAVVAIPLAEILALAEKHDPRLAPVAQPLSLSQQRKLERTQAKF